MSYRGAGTLIGPLRFEGTLPPDVSAASEGRIYFDSATNTFKVSQNGGSYVNLFGLQANYDNGPSILTSTAVGPVTISGQDANDDNVIQVDKTPAGTQSGQAINVGMGANATGDGVRVLNSGTGAAFSAFTTAGGPALRFVADVLATGVLGVEGSVNRTVPLNTNTAGAVYSANNVSQFAGDAAGSSVVAFLATTPTRVLGAGSSLVANLVLNDAAGGNSYDLAMLSVFDDLVIGAIDPLGSDTYVKCVSPLRISTGVPGAAPHAILDDGDAAPVSLAATGAVRYSDTTKQLEQSIDGGPWAPLGTPATTTVTSATVLTATQAMVFADSTGGPFTITLASAAAAAPGSKVTIKDSGGAAGANNITIAPPGAETIDGVASVVLIAGYDAIEVVSNGTNWFLI